MPGAGKRAGNGAHGSVAAYGDYHVGAVVQRLLCADAAVLIELGFDELDVVKPVIRAV